MKDKRVNISDWIIYIGMICIFRCIYNHLFSPWKTVLNAE